MKASITLLVLVLFMSTVNLTRSDADGDPPICSTTAIQDGDPYARALAKVLTKIMGDLPKMYPVNEYCTSSSYKSIKAYGYGSCVDQGVACFTCLNDALTAISDACGNTYGARIAVAGCSLRFEAFRFC
ncbi:hypothetical protein LINPERHAP1_LOCUS26901 [Linum perenne]